MEFLKIEHQFSNVFAHSSRTQLFFYLDSTKSVPQKRHFQTRIVTTFNLFLNRVVSLPQSRSLTLHLKSQNCFVVIGFELIGLQPGVPDEIDKTQHNNEVHLISSDWQDLWESERLLPDCSAEKCHSVSGRSSAAVEKHFWQHRVESALTAATQPPIMWSDPVQKMKEFVIETQVQTITRGEWIDEKMAVSWTLVVAIAEYRRHYNIESSSSEHRQTARQEQFSEESLTSASTWWLRQVHTSSVSS
jgi:hypothetical protein